MSKLSFVIPCYGSELTLRGVYDEICDKMSERPQYSFEIIAVNDCSPDNVFEVIKSIAEEDNRFKAVQLAKNGGKHAAIMAGFSYATGDIIVNLDDDGQCPMDRLWELIAPLDNGYDIAIAKYTLKKESIFKRFGSKMNALMAKHLLSKPKDLQLSNFSALKRFVMDEILNYRNPYPYIDGLFLRTTSRIVNVQMEQRERYAGKGNYTFAKSLALWINGFTAFSVKPLRIATIIGCLCAFIGFVVGIIMVIRKLINPDIAAGYTSLIAVLLFIGGLIMLMLGLIGEYIGRIYISLNNSPQYVIRDTINVKETEKDEMTQ